ncbi:MAG: alpha/beta hydrolase [Myxococcales bacterium]|nr:alpha/beta hydrolase [Myxococcales bacterium]
MVAPSPSSPSPRALLRFELQNGITIAADSFGSPDAQPVIFLHGGGQTRHAWGGTAEELGALGFYAVSMDHRGHGDSSWDPAGDYSIDAFVSDLLGVIDEVGATPVLVGASIGGIAALMAETRSDASIAKGLVLVDVTPRMEKRGVLRIFDFMKGHSNGFESLEAAGDAVASYLPHRQRPKDLSGLNKNLRLSEDGRYRWHWDPKMLEAWNPDGHTKEDGERIVKERAKASRRLTIPTLLVRGRMSDVVTEAHAREFLDLVPHAEYVDLEGASHMVAGDKNDVFTESVSHFVRKHFEAFRK